MCVTFQTVVLLSGPMYFMHARMKRDIRSLFSNELATNAEPLFSFELTSFFFCQRDCGFFMTAFDEMLTNDNYAMISDKFQSGT